MMVLLVNDISFIPLIYRYIYVYLYIYVALPKNEYFFSLKKAFSWFKDFMI